MKRTLVLVAALAFALPVHAGKKASTFVCVRSAADVNATTPEGTVDMGGSSEVDVHRMSANHGSFDLGRWTGRGGTGCELTAEAGVMRSMRQGGSVY
jgi:hypothetical protein